MVKVLVVDDSGFFRRTLCKLLETDRNIKVIAQACNGEEAIEMVEQYHPDVITMDVEMPKMDGITAVKRIMSKNPTPILMFSNLTEQGAKTTLEALHAGAADFLPKNFQHLTIEQDELVEILVNRIKVLAIKNKNTAYNTEELSQKIESKTVEKQDQSLVKISNYNLIAIGASTGGPVALEKVLTKLPASFPSPIIIVQHMPQTFTKTFADRLNNLCKINVSEAENNMQVLPGNAYIAPGGKQLYVKKTNSEVKLIVKDSSEKQIYKPSVDETFNSIADEYKKQNVLAIVMTGMGSDGCIGAKRLKQIGATVWAQDKSTSVVYGMPMAIASENLADKVLAVDDIGNYLAKTA